MKPIRDIVINNISTGMTQREAENYACQQIVLSKISKSKYNNQVFIKGGVVMFNYTHTIRRTTNDLDFDFSRYDISEESLRRFIADLNDYDKEYVINVESIEELHQDDYHGKRMWVSIFNQGSKLKFKIDIGVHTLFMIDQDELVFAFTDDNETLTMKANPPEQIFAEKAYSLAKHGLLSERYKDVFDMYYLIKNKNMDRKIIKETLDLLTMNKLYDLSSAFDVVDRVSCVFENKRFKERLKSSKQKWLDVNDEMVLKSILDYLYTI